MWDHWDLVLLGIAGYVAVMSLIRLMSSRRRELTAKFRGEVRAEHVRQQQETARAQREAARRRDDAA